MAAASFFAAPADIVAALDSASAQQPAWITVERPYPAFELLMPELAGSTYNYAILRRAKDGARKDVLSWGEPADAGPYVMVEIYRPAAASDRFIDAPSEIAARIVDFTVTDDVKPAGQIDSKFGAVPLVDFAIARRANVTAPLPRLRAAVRRARHANRRLVLQRRRRGGGPRDGRLPARPADLLSAGGDAKLAEMFARAEVKRTFCGQRNPILAATPEREERIAPLQPAKLRAALRGRMPARVTAFGAELTSRNSRPDTSAMSLASSSLIGAPNALIILVTSAFQPAALRNGEFIWI